LDDDAGMSQIVRWFHEGGFAMFPILLLAVVGLVGAVVGLAVGLASRRRGTMLAFGIGLVAVAVLCAGIGAISFVAAQQKVEAALVAVDPSQRELLRTVGEAEARVPLTFGLGASSLPALAGMILVAAGLARTPEPTARR
jgi:hypothetical protein